MSNGLGPKDRRLLRETIVAQFFSSVGDKQVADLDKFFEDQGIAPFSHKGVSYHPSIVKPVPFYRQLDPELVPEFEKFLKVYQGLDMEMASMSSLLTRLFRKCNSIADMRAVLPEMIQSYGHGLEIAADASDDALHQYLQQADIASMHDDPMNREAILKVKVRLMRDEVFGR